MTGSESDCAFEDPERLDYFMIRLARWEHAPDRVAGLVERLATGEKRQFETVHQLVRLVLAWDAPVSNMEVLSD
jgi:hypothetical protein